MNLDGCKIAIVGPLPPPFGGMAVQTELLSQRLRSEYLSVSMIQTNAALRMRWIKRIRYVRAVVSFLIYTVALIIRIPRSDLVHIMANSGLSWHLSAVPAILAATFFRKPIVMNYRGGGAGKFFRQSWRRIEKNIHRAAKIIVPSQFLVEVFSRYGVDTLVVPNLLDSSLFDTTGSNPVKTDAPHLVTVRNLRRICGNDIAIEAMRLIKREFPAARLSIVGTGPEDERLRMMTGAYSLADSVVMMGQLERAQVAALMKTADILLNPSRIDNSPNAVIEALACGLPVVAAEVGGVPYMVANRESAMLVPKDDYRALAHAAIEILRNPELASHLRQNGKVVARKYCWESVRIDLGKVYADVLRKT